MHNRSKNIAHQMVNNGLTYQEQSWNPSTNEGAQLVFIPATRVDNCEVTAIIEEYKLFFHLHIIELMFTQEPELQTTWDVCQSVQSNTCDIDQGIHNALVVPTTNLSNGDINCCICRYVKLWQYRVPLETFKELSEESYCQPNSSCHTIQV